MDDRVHALQQMAQRIEQAGLREPATILLDVLGPLDVIGSQLALFVRPLVRGTSLHFYTDLLTDSANWRVLHRLLARQ